MVRIFSQPCSAARRSKREKTSLSSATIASGSSFCDIGVNPTTSAKSTLIPE
ncbi:MAG TPA: hypothetical protein VJA44_03365 [Acidimicrobiia bacterium]|nr:hypothetical protein [Acidimicrobiia bacterium]